MITFSALMQIFIAYLIAELARAIAGKIELRL